MAAQQAAKKAAAAVSQVSLCPPGSWAMSPLHFFVTVYSLLKSFFSNLNYRSYSTPIYIVSTTAFNVLALIFYREESTTSCATMENQTSDSELSGLHI